MKTTIIQRLLLFMLLAAGAGDAWALWRNDIGFTAINRASQSGNVITSANNAGNQYALAIADLSQLPGIRSAGYFTLSFEVSFTQGSRWQIGIGNKDVRGTNANSSNTSSYNTTGLMMHIGDDGGTYYRVKINEADQYGTNNSSAYNEAYGKTVRVSLQFNRNTGRFNYSLTDVDNNTVYFTGSDIATTVEYLSLVEAYTWANNASVTLSNITINYNFFFEKSDETIYIEDLVYNNPLDNAENKSNVNISVDNSYLRRDNNNYYPITTTGSQPTNTTEGDYTIVTATATDANDTRLRVRIKTRNELDPNAMVVAATNTFEAGSTLGMFTDQRVYLDGMTLYLGYQGHTPVVRSINGDYGLTIIDSNGWSFGNYDQGHEWGTVYKIATTEAKNLTVSGYFAANSSNALQLYDSSNQAISGKSLSNPGDGSLATATFALDANQTYLLYVQGSVFALKSLSYGDAYFEHYYAITTIGNAYTQTVSNMNSPVYSIVGKEGDIASTGVTIDSNTGEVSNITAGGALKIQATGGGKTCIYYLTVAYPATDYPGHLWNFCTDVDVNGNEVRRELDVSDNLKTAPTPIFTTTDSYGEEWRFEYKNSNTGVERDPRWYRTKAVDGDNAFIVKETNGLVFVTGGRNFYLRNDAAEFTHIGIRGLGIGASFTIPALEAGDIIEIMWRHDASGSGSAFIATNVTDLRGKDVDEEFLITESARRGNSNTRFVGYYSFIAKGGDVTFTLHDTGNCDIQSIRIYKGPYRSTMRNINLSGNTAAPTTMLLDNAQQTNTYNYCNQLYSTATGPAMYVLKGYRKNNGGTLGVDYDHEGCVKGSNAAYSPEFFIDEDAYPVSDAEKTRLYELRKNIVGLEMYNDTWQSSNNSYNNGVIKATSGWGKVTIRMNNYTNDMKYVIGYTPDYTLTIGSAPHQTYPYTWDFTKIAGQAVTGLSDNVLYSIEAEGSNSAFASQAPTNWFKNENGQFMLNTDNSGEMGSQYVPGAVLVTQDRALSKFNGAPYTDKYANDELTGLGFDGDITMHIDHLPSDVSSGWNRATVADVRSSLLSFKITDYAVFTQTGGTEEEPIGTWSNPATAKPAGNGTAQIHANVSIDESSIPSGGIGCRLDGGDTKYIHLSLNMPLQAGDIISVTAYNAYNNRDAGISFNKSASSSDVVQSLLLTGYLMEETLNYTVTTNDGLDGRSDFYVYKYTNTVHVTAVEITRSASAVPDLDWSIYTLTNTTITVPDLNADSKQDWIYVSASAEPESVTNATKVTAGDDGPDANMNVYKYKVTDSGDSKITFTSGTKIYKIGVTHILKEIHPVGGTGWATEIRNQDIDHELIGYFTTNDVNAYTVKYDSYDMKTATVALTPINENGYVPKKTGIVMKLDNAGGLSDANAGKNVPLFYPSYTRPATTTLVDFPTNNMMYQDDNGIESDNRNYNETYNVESTNYTKFILTNKYWTFDKDHALSTDEAAIQHTAEAAGFYRMHIWKTGDVETKNTMPAHTAYLLVPSDNLPAAVWTLQSGYSAARETTLGVYNIIGPNSATGIEEIELIQNQGNRSHDSLGEASDQGPVPIDSGVWYTLSGVKLPKRPTKAGLYIRNGQKVSVNPRGR